MNNDITELNEAVRRIAAHQEYQSKISKWSFVTLLLTILVGVALSVYWDSRFKEIEKPKVESKDWYDVNMASRKGDLKTALHIADDLLLKTPLDFDGFYKRGEIQIMLGSNEKAKDDFQTAFKIFPISKYKAAADAIAFRLNQQSNEAVAK